MFTLLIALDLVFVILMLYEGDKTKAIILGGLASFLGFGAYRLSFDGTNYQYAFIPLAFVVISLVWSIYKVYLIISDANKRDWGTEVEELD